ncbi:MAG: hypothetical protein E7388_06255 [Ruminococcaceae bacterium]|nr:hypothetical protein [Oscillospiraceae bacterium]
MKKNKLFCIIICVSLCLSLLTSYAVQVETNIPNELDTLSENEPISLRDGLVAFKRYINENLPIEYLGAELMLSGACDEATKIAAVKLAQYRLNQKGAELTIDGVFGEASQTAFSNLIRGIRRYQTGDWVYIIKGLLFYHGYNPGSFDGEYDRGENLGCLDAVNQFKLDNIIDEGSHVNGLVGIETIKCLLWQSGTRTVPDGMFYIKNALSEMYLNVQSNTPEDGNYVSQATQLTGNNNLRQLWKITYVGNGYYSIRSMQNIPLALNNYNNENVGLADITLYDNGTTVVGGSKWKIVEVADGVYNILWSNHSDKALALGSDTSENAGITIDDPQIGDKASWSFEKKITSSVYTHLYIDNSFKEYFGPATNVAASTAKSMYTTAIIPFTEFFNVDVSCSLKTFSNSLISDLCQHGYYNTVAEGTCCTPNSCSHNVNTDAECKCGYRIYNTLKDIDSIADLKTGFFTFDSCVGGLGGVNGNTTVVLIGRNSDPSSTAYMHSIRRIQHETTHNWGGNHTSEENPCTSRCINNGGFDNVYDYDLTCIWCNRCLSQMTINKF